jgi:hypothetical protein
MSRIASACTSSSLKAARSSLLAGRARVGLADDLDRAVEVVVDLGERVEDVDARLELSLLVLEPPRDDQHAEVEELAAEVAERDAGRLADHRVRRGQQRRQVYVEVRLQRRVLVQEGHRGFRRRLGLQLEDDANVVGRLVADVDHLRELPRHDQLGDLLDQLRLVHRVGDRRDDDEPLAARAGLDLVLAAEPDRPLPALVDVAQLLLAVQDLAAGREVGAFHVLEQPLHVEVGLVDERGQRRDDLLAGCAAGCWSPCRRRCPSTRS